ncbi:MAG: pilin [Patescibacteria group bacterium]
MNRLRNLSLSLFLVALSAAPVLADSADVSKVTNFMTNVIQILVTVAGLLAVIFFVVGGIGYITSSGNPEKLDSSKKTLVYSAIGLAITIGAFVLTNIVSGVANTAFK